MTVTHAFQIVYLVTMLAAAAYALARGGTAERWAIVWLVICSVLTRALESPKSVRWHHAELVVLAIDALLLAALTATMLRSRRLWPIPAVAIQLVAVVTHVAMLLDHGIVPRVYSWAQGFWAYPIMALIALGTARRGAAAARSQAL